ncbi:lysozyme inhibitor LprI family protein [Serratia rubidaea]|uniref:DUF1311 domain-containing protein n=1 Tax=Serratia rubidaea TaxID=61652 RepID=A0A3S5AZ17_SERRU|nr:lysozyme inhibitor LprI family protein [Serratia rubidaea]MBH1928902.1 DUF1311 domain-containing protein [Serratia rubidaea]MDC6118678.1 lysozyme inhibitor LprI family protein [Serratia rubidaea]MEB7587134.1 lysozyme inhibitor LprI family protein [Serratia rubidaea]VEI69174.1 Uncharacterised protein [Serratia rubidaea]
MNNKKIYQCSVKTILLLFSSVCSSFADEMKPAVVPNVAQQMIIKQQEKLCITEDSRGSSARAMAECADLLLSDSQRHLDSRMVEVKEYLAYYDRSTKGYEDNGKEYLAAFNKYLATWREFVSAKCGFLYFEFKDPAKYIETHTCQAEENYLLEASLRRFGSN